MLKVFISDDSATVRTRLVTMALDLPEVDVVGQGQDAPRSLDAIRRTRPDVVILDIRMPGGNGIEVLREVKKMTPPPKVIILTNMAHVQYRIKCEEAGSDFFFDKSIEFDQIPLALEQVRHGLRAIRARTSAPPVQTPDLPIPADDGLTPTSRQNAGARGCPRLARDPRAVYSKERGGPPVEQEHFRRSVDKSSRSGQSVVGQAHRRRPGTYRGEETENPWFSNTKKERIK